MLTAVVLPLLGAALLLALAPAVLTRGSWQVSRPRLALVLWFSALGAGVAAVLAAAVVAMVATVSPAASQGPLETIVLTVLSWSALAGLGGVVALVLASSEPLTAADGQLRELAAIASAREERRGFVLIRVRSDEPIVCAVAGAEPAIWLSSGAERLLGRVELQAVLMHEYAHLRGRHHWAVRLAAVNARCLPARVPAGPALQRATSLLVELIADDAAARHAGPAELANALATLGRATRAPAMLLRAERLTRRRWPRPSRRRLPQAVRLPA